MDKCQLHNDRLSTIEADIKLLLERTTQTKTILYTASGLSAWAVGIAIAAFAAAGK